MSRRALQVRLGFSSETGKRPDNQDYVGAIVAEEVVAALADGVGGRKGGRVAAETAVRGFIDGYLSQPPTLGPQRAAARTLEPLNRWIHGQGRADPVREGMSAAFAALVLRRRAAHVTHAGDVRVYRYAEGVLERLTEDHNLGRGELAHALTRAVGFEPSLKLDHLALGLALHDRFLMCSDGVHGALSDGKLAALLAPRGEAQETAAQVVAAALAAGSADNCSALVLDVLDLPTPEPAELSQALAQLPILPPPKTGDEVDGLLIGELISDGRYARVFHASAETGPPLAVKFPRKAEDSACRLALARESFVAARVRSPYVGEVVEWPRRSRLYLVMPFYEGETLERRLQKAPLPLHQGVAFAVKLARALDALHRIGIVHRDVKPDNVILTPDGNLRLIDLGVARVEGFEEAGTENPGTPSFMAPELFQGRTGDAASDLYALGVTVYRMFSAAYPYGEVEPFMTPRFEAYTPLARRRPDLPAWLDVALEKAVARAPADRFGDVIEFAHALESGVKRAGPGPTRVSAPLYERNPLLVWKIATFLLALAVLALLARNSAHL